MNLKEAIKVLAQFEELFGDGGNGGNGGDGEKREIKWQFPEAWETEVVEADWGGVPKGVRRLMVEIGEDPNKILEWGIRDGSEEVVIWALENGADANEVFRFKEYRLVLNFPSPFVRKIVEDYVTDERIKDDIYVEMLREGARLKDEQTIKDAVELGLSFKEKGEVLRDIGFYLPSDLAEGFAADYNMDTKSLQEIRVGILANAIENKSRKDIIDILEKGADLYQLYQTERDVFIDFCEGFYPDFVVSVIEDYVDDDILKEELYTAMLKCGISLGDDEMVYWAIHRGADITRLKDKELRDIGGIISDEYLSELLKEAFGGDVDKDNPIVGLIYAGALKSSIDYGDEEGILRALENGADVYAVKDNDWERFGAEFPVDFVERVVREYFAEGKIGIRESIYAGMLEQGLRSGDKDRVITALRSGLNVSRLRLDKDVEKFLGPDWRRYLPTRE